MTAAATIETVQIRRKARPYEGDRICQAMRPLSRDRRSRCVDDARWCFELADGRIVHVCRRHASKGERDRKLIARFAAVTR